jgi:hypothetical protein
VQTYIKVEPVKRATARTQTNILDTEHPLASTTLHKPAAAHHRGLCFSSVVILGFRCARPQALCCHALRGLSDYFFLGNGISIDTSRLYSL